MVLCNRNERKIYGICACASCIFVEIIVLLTFAGKLSLKISRPSSKTGVIEEKPLTRSSICVISLFTNQMNTIT